MRRTREATQYVVGWLLAGTVVAIVLLQVVHRAPSPPSLPAVRAIALEDAVRSARCHLVGGTRSPPARGGGSPRAGIFGRPLLPLAAAAAAADGLVVIEYRRDVDRAFVRDLQSVQRTLPAATLLAPAAGRPRDAIALIAGRRSLGCPFWGPRTLDAVRLFRGRYVGLRRHG